MDQRCVVGLRKVGRNTVNISDKETHKDKRGRTTERGVSGLFVSRL